MFKDELKNLSEEIFFDNEHGGITPHEQRRFYHELIDKVVTGDELEEIDLTGVQSDVIPDNNLAKNLGSEAKVWKTLFTSAIGAGAAENEIRLQNSIIPTDDAQSIGNEENPVKALYANYVNGVTLIGQGSSSRFLSADGSYKEINSGWNDIQTGTTNEIQINLGWTIVGDIMILQGTLSIPSQIQPVVELPGISPDYLNRIKTGTSSLYTSIKKGNNIQFAQITLQVQDEKLILSILPDELTTDIVTVYFSPFFIPLTSENRVEINEQNGVDYSEWDYSEVEENNTRCRTARPWTQKVYSDGTTGVKNYGESYPDTEQATRITIEPGEWNYTLSETKQTCNRTREVETTWHFTDDEYRQTTPESGMAYLTKLPTGEWQYDKFYQEGHRYTLNSILGYDFVDYIYPAANTSILPEEYKQRPLAVSEKQYYIYNLTNDTVCSNALYTFPNETIDGKNIIQPYKVYLKSDSSKVCHLPAGYSEILLNGEESTDYFNLYFNAIGCNGYEERSAINPSGGYEILSWGQAGAIRLDDRWNYLKIETLPNKLVCESYENYVCEDFSGSLYLNIQLVDFEVFDSKGDTLFAFTGTKSFEVNQAKDGDILFERPPALWFTREANKVTVTGNGLTQITPGYSFDQLLYEFPREVPYGFLAISTEPRENIFTTHTFGYLVGGVRASQTDDVLLTYTSGLQENGTVTSNTKILDEITNRGAITSFVVESDGDINKPTRPEGVFVSLNTMLNTLDMNLGYTDITYSYSKGLIDATLLQRVYFTAIPADVYNRCHPFLQPLHIDSLFPAGDGVTLYEKSYGIPVIVRNGAIYRFLGFVIEFNDVRPSSDNVGCTVFYAFTDRVGGGPWHLDWNDTINYKVIEINESYILVELVTGIFNDIMQVVPSPGLRLDTKGVITAEDQINLYIFYDNTGGANSYYTCLVYNSLNLPDKFKE